MERKCRSCGKSIDEGLVKCPFCGYFPSEEEEPPLSPEQIRQIAKQVKKEFITPLIYGLGILSIIFGIGFWQAYRAVTEQTQKLLVQRISEEFQQPTIRQTVQDVAASNAQQILKEEIQPEVIKFRAEIESTIQKTKELVNSTQSQLNSLTFLIELEDAARYGSRTAFINLLQISFQEDPFGKMAQRRIAAIKRDLLIYRSVPNSFFTLSITMNGKTQNVDKLSTSELFLQLESPTMTKEHIPSLMAHIAKKPKQEVCKEAKRVLETSDSLIACAATCGILSKVLGNKAEFLAFEDWLKICDGEPQNIE